MWKVISCLSLHGELWKCFRTETNFLEIYRLIGDSNSYPSTRSRYMSSKLENLPPPSPTIAQKSNAKSLEAFQSRQGLFTFSDLIFFVEFQYLCMLFERFHTSVSFVWFRIKSNRFSMFCAKDNVTYASC